MLEEEQLLDVPPPSSLQCSASLKLEWDWASAIHRRAMKMNAEVKPKSYHHLLDAGEHHCGLDRRMRSLNRLRQHADCLINDGILLCSDPPEEVMDFCEHLNL